MPRKGYKSVSLPDNLIKKIDGAVGSNSSSWKSRADLVTYAVRRCLDEIQSTEQRKVVSR